MEWWNVGVMDQAVREGTSEAMNRISTTDNH